MYTQFQKHLQNELSEITNAGLYKDERIIVSPQDAEVTLDSGQKVINFCANNYLGLSNDAELVKSAKESLDSHGYGMSSVRFICGTTDIHKELEQKIAQFFGTEETPSCMLLVLMPMEVYLSHFLLRKMRLFLMH